MNPAPSENTVIIRSRRNWKHKLIIPNTTPEALLPTAPKIIASIEQMYNGLKKNANMPKIKPAVPRPEFELLFDIYILLFVC